MSDMPLPYTPKTKKGGQPGNLNALKHGFYLNNARIRGTAPLKSADLDCIAATITYIRDYMRRIYDSGNNSTSLVEVSEATRSLALAGLALVRLIDLQDLINSNFYGPQKPTRVTPSGTLVNT